MVVVECPYEDSYFEFVAETSHSYGVDYVHVIGDGKPKNGYRIPVRHYNQINKRHEPVDLPWPPKTIVILDKDKGIPLKEFVHPADVVYSIGSNSPDTKSYKPEDAVYIKVDTPVDYSLWNFIALALVLDDRNNKGDSRPN